MIYQKFTISLVIIGCLLMAGYFATFKHESSNTQSKVPTSVTISETGSTTKSGTETDTIKRLNTVSESGSSWGMTPFGSGKPLTEEHIPTKPVVKKPNLEWKTRTIQLKDGRWMTYEFGKGNPVGVSLSADELKAAYKRCGSVEDPMNNGPFCGEEDGYMSKETEQHLLAVLSDPNWDVLLNTCKENLMYPERLSPEGYVYAPYEFTYAQILNPSFRDINTWILIDENTGRMELNKLKMFGLATLLDRSTYESWRGYNPTETYPYKNPTCVDVYAKEILNQLKFTRWEYISLVWTK